jgi:hypothetical protein
VSFIGSHRFISLYFIDLSLKPEFFRGGIKDSHYKHLLLYHIHCMESMNDVDGAQRVPQHLVVTKQKSLHLWVKITKAPSKGNTSRKYTILVYASKKNSPRPRIMQLREEGAEHANHSIPLRYLQTSCKAPMGIWGLLQFAKPREPYDGAMFLHISYVRNIIHRAMLKNDGCFTSLCNRLNRELLYTRDE